MKQSKELTEFYREWLEWSSSPYVEEHHPHFSISRGLCTSARLWGKRYENDARPFTLMDELSRQFDEAGLSMDYPFGLGEFNTDFGRGTMHKCPKRLAWVRDRLRGES